MSTGTLVGLPDILHQEGITVLHIVGVVLLHLVTVLLGGSHLAVGRLHRGINHIPLEEMGRHQKGHLHHHMPARDRNLVPAHLVPDPLQLLPLVGLPHPLESAVAGLVLLVQELKVRRSANDLGAPPHVPPAQVLTNARERMDKYNAGKRNY